MRIACLYSGEMRSFCQCWASHQALGATFHHFHISEDVSADLVTSFVGTDAPHAVHVETIPAELEERAKRYTRQGIGNTSSRSNLIQLWLLKRAWETFAGQDDCDLVVRMRYDVKIWYPGPRLAEYRNDALTVPTFANWWGLNDRFGVMPPDIARQYFCRLDDLDEYYDAGGLMHMETFLGWVARKYRWPIARTPILFNLQRPDGQIDGVYHEPAWGDTPFVEALHA